MQLSRDNFPAHAYNGYDIPQVPGLPVWHTKSWILPQQSSTVATWYGSRDIHHNNEICKESGRPDCLTSLLHAVRLVAQQVQG